MNYKVKFKKIYIEITNVCNKNCSFCIKSNKKKREMTVNEFKKVVSKIKRYTDYVYLHVKGEPLLHSGFGEIIKICEENNLKVNITTNGTLLEKRMDIIKKSPCIRQINISLHSFEDDKNIEKIIKILDVVKKIHDETNIIFSLRLWNMKDNELSLENKNIINEIVKLYDVLDDSIYINKSYKIGKNLYLNKDKMFDWPSLELKNYSNIGYCYGLKTHVAILSDGTVVPCCLDSDGILNLGNIFNETIEEILQKEKTKKIILGFQNRKVEEELCKKCTYKERFKK